MDEKAIEILKIIIQFGPISGPDIFACLNQKGIDVSLKVIRKIIKEWNQLLCLIGDGSMRIETLINQGYQLNHSYFSSAELRFFQDAITSSNLLNQDEKARMKALFDPLGICEEHTTLNTPSGFLHHLSVIDKAIVNQKTLLFSYLDFFVSESDDGLQVAKKYRNKGNQKEDKSGETYIISPYEIMMHKGQYYVLSYCDKHPDDLTIFRIDRMDKVRLSKNNYFHDLKKIVDYDKKKQQLVNMYVGQKECEKIRIQFDKEIFKTIVDEFGTHLKLSRSITGKPILELESFAVSEGLIGWIMMMGNQVEVLSPQFLIDEIYERLEGLLLRYKSSRNL